MNCKLVRGDCCSDAGSRAVAALKTSADGWSIGVGAKLLLP